MKEIGDGHLQSHDCSCIMQEKIFFLRFFGKLFKAFSEIFCIDINGLVRLINQTFHKSLESARNRQSHMSLFLQCPPAVANKNTLNKLENFTLYLATSPFPIQLFHWFFPMFRSFTQMKEFKIQFEIYTHGTIGLLDSRRNYFLNIFFFGQIAIYYYIISQQQRAKNASRLFSVVSLVICRGSENNIKNLWSII